MRNPTEPSSPSRGFYGLRSKRAVDRWQVATPEVSAEAELTGQLVEPRHPVGEAPNNCASVYPNDHSAISVKI